MISHPPNAAPRAAHGSEGAFAEGPNVFICFAPEERDFVRDLDEALKKHRRFSGIDWGDAAAASGDPPEARAKIEAAATFIFIVSPHSLASPACREHLERAARLRKRVVPVIRVDVPREELPAALSAAEPINYRHADSVSQAFKAVVRAINTELKIDDFICYSRRDGEFVRKLYGALRESGRSTWIDLKSIEPTGVWEQEIYAGIEAADNFLFILSEDSVRETSFCRRELAHAVKHNKRLIPVLLSEVEDAHVPAELSPIQRVEFLSRDDFYGNFLTLTRALNKDLAYVRRHTRLLTRAIEWADNGNDKSHLLRGTDLREAEELWRASARKTPKLTELQEGYVAASRKDERRRRGVTTGALAAAFLSLTLLSAWLAYANLSAAVEQQLAEIERDAARRARDEADEQRDRATLQSGLAIFQGYVADAEREQAVVARALAEVQRERAETQTRVAEERRREAETNLAAYYFSGSQLESEERNDPVKAFLWAYKASRAAPAADAHSGFYAERARHLGLALPRIDSVGPGVTQAAFSRDLSRVAAAKSDSLLVWDLDEGRPPRELRVPPAEGEAGGVAADAGRHNYRVDDPVLSDDGRLVAASIRYFRRGTEQGESVEKYAWTAASGERLPEFPESAPFTDDRFPVLPGTGLQPSPGELNLSLLKSLHGDDVNYSNDTLRGFGRLAVSTDRTWFLVVWNNPADNKYSVQVVDYLKEASVPEAPKPVTLGGTVSSVGFGPDCSWFATVSAYRDEHDDVDRYRLQVWETKTGLKLSEGRMYDDKPFTILDVSPDGSKILTHSISGELRVWDWREAQDDLYFVAVPQLLDYPVLITEKYNGPRAMFGAGGDAVITISGFDVAIRSNAVADPTMRTDTYDVRVWDLETQKQVGKTVHLRNDLVAFAISPADLRLGTVSPDGKVMRWEMAGIRTDEVARLPFDARRAEKPFANVLFKPDRLALLTESSADSARGGEDRHTTDFMLWDSRTGKALWQKPLTLVQGHDRYTHCAFSRDGARLVTASPERAGGGDKVVLQVWDARTGAGPLGRPVTVDGNVRRVALSADGTSLVAAFGANDPEFNVENPQAPHAAPYVLKVQRWKVQTGEPLSEPVVYPQQGTEPTFVVAGFSADGEFYLAGEYAEGWDEFLDPYVLKNLSLRRASDGKVVSPVFRFDKGSPVTLAFVASLLQQARGFRETSGQTLLVELDERTRLAVESSGGATTVRRVGDGLPLAAPSGRHLAGATLRFSPSGAWVIAPTLTGREARIWGTTLGKPLTEGFWHESEVLASAFLPGGRELITVTREGMVRRWEVSGRGGPGSLAGLEADLRRLGLAEEVDSVAAPSFARGGR
jgi:WD40 repeat protein